MSEHGPNPYGNRYTKKERAAMGRRLMAARELARLSRRDVANQLNVTLQAVTNWEHGTLPSDEHRPALSELYGQPATVLFAEFEARMAAARALLSDGEPA